MLILSQNYDGRTGTGREVTFDLYGRVFTIALTGYEWADWGLPTDDHGTPSDRRTVSRHYEYQPEPGTLAEWRDLYAPRPIQMDWLAERAESAGFTRFATVAAVIAADLAELGNRAMTGWAATTG